MHAEDCIFFQLARAGRAGIRYWQREVASLGVTAVQAAALVRLAEQDDVPSAHLGRRLQLDSASLTGLLDRLAAAGHIERRPDPDDRRAIRVVLTADGQATAHRLRPLMVDANRRFLAGLSGEEAAHLRSLLCRVSIERGE